MALRLSAGGPDEPAARTVPLAAIPHVALGGGWRTVVRVPNPTKLFQDVRLETYNAQGIGIQASNGGVSAYSFTYSIPPLGIADFELTRDGAPVDAYALLLFLGGSALPHGVQYRSPGGERGALGKPAGALYASEYFQFDVTGEGRTSAAFLAPVASTELIHRIACYSSSGMPLGAYSFSSPGFRSAPQGGYWKFSFEMPRPSGALEESKGTCYFSQTAPNSTVEKAVARPVISLRLIDGHFLPLTY